MSDQVHAGVISFFNEERAFGNVEYTPNGIRKVVFFSLRGVLRDNKGSIAWSFVVGTPVKFKVSDREVRKRGLLPYAFDVEPEWKEKIDLTGYRETSTVHSWDGQTGFLTRPCGSRLFFAQKGISLLFLPLLPELTVGSWVNHGIHKGKKGLWYATDIEIFSESDFEPDPVVEPESDPEATSEIFQPSLRSLSINEIIKRKKSHAVESVVE